MSQDHLLVAFKDNKTYHFGKADEHTSSVFGGPLETHIWGRKPGPKPLHSIAYLGFSTIPAISDLPLLYGLCYEGCSIRYKIESTGQIELIELSPIESSDNWPYPDYSPQLPYFPIHLTNVSDSTYHSFAEPYFNLPENQPSDLVVVVPPPVNLGVSLWGRSGDLEGVTIVFEYDPQTRIVHGYNICT